MGADSLWVPPASITLMSASSRALNIPSIPARQRHGRAPGTTYFGLQKSSHAKGPGSQVPAS
jgi:hypothetical protein